MADKLTEDKTSNPLYDFPTFYDRWGSLPVETPRFNYTPNSSLIESEPRKVEPFKLTPVEGDPFERAAQRLRAPYKHVNDVTDDKFPYRSNLPLIANKFIGIAQRGATSPQGAFRGEFPVTDPETGMPTDEAIRRSQDVASLGGPGGLIEREPGAIVGSGPIASTTVSDAFKNRFLPNGVPKPEAFDRVLPAVRNLETGKISTTKRGDEHATILDRLWQKQGGDPNVSTLELYNEMLPKNEMGFYDPKNKEFFPRSHPDWQNIDSPDLNPRQAMRSGMVFSDTSKPGMAMASTFYSAVENAVNNVKSNKMPADQWLGTLNNAKGVKPEEMDWLGLKEHLASKGKEPVTKQEVQDFVNANKVELKEVNKGNTWSKEENDRLNQLEGLRNPSEAEKIELNNLLDRAEKLNNNATTKFSQYQLPGGVNYREMLLTLPSGMQQYDSFLQGLKSKYGDKPWGQMPLTEAESNKINKLMNKGGDDTKNYRSSHWDEPNVLAHVRMNDRTIEGKKSLHLEEIQSDWHQAGRQQGYQSDAYTLPEGMKVTRGVDPPFVVRDTEGHARGTGETEQEAIGMAARHSGAGVPDAPFKKTWHELALKRMIREAAEKGYDRISWTPGEAQAARYDLSKQVDSILYRKRDDGNFDVSIKPKGSSQYEKQLVSGDKLPDFIGKEMAEKMHNNEGKEINTAGNNEPKKIYREMTGLDLKVGGEGMKGFYDKMIPNAIEKIGKEHGVKVKTAEIEKPNPTIEPPGFKKTQKVHYIDIPQSLKDVAMKKGFPLFSGGFMFSPVAGNPMEDKK